MKHQDVLIKMMECAPVAMLGTELHKKAAVNGKDVVSTHFMGRSRLQAVGRDQDDSEPAVVGSHAHVMVNDGVEQPGNSILGAHSEGWLANACSVHCIFACNLTRKVVFLWSLLRHDQQTDASDI